MASTSSGSSMPSSVAPATVQLDASAREASPKPITWLPESPMKTAAGRPGRRLNGRKPAQANAERERETSSTRFALLAHARRRAREHGAGDRGECGGEAVHVVEQVEGVRDPDEPDQADHESRARRCRRPRPRARSRARFPRRANWAASFIHGPERVEVVREPGQEEERAAGEDSEQLRARLDRTDGDREQHARDEAGEDADAAEDRRRALRASARRSARRRAARRGGSAGASRGREPRPGRPRA